MPDNAHTHREAPPEHNAWDLSPGATMPKKELRDRFGGNSRTPVSAPEGAGHVFLFVDPSAPRAARWYGRVLHVSGTKIRRTALNGANRAVLEHRETGRALQVFWRSGADLIYAGEFEVDSREAFRVVEAVGAANDTEQRVVFRLRPVGAFVRAPGVPVEGTSKPSGDREAETPTTELPLPHPGSAADQERPVGKAPAEGTKRPSMDLPASEQPPTPPGRPPLPLPGIPAQRPVRNATGLARRLFSRPRTDSGAGWTWPVILLLSSAAVALTTWGWTSSPLRPAVTTWFLLVVPGMALVRLLPPRGAVTRLVLAVATSLAVETLIAEAALEGRFWSSSGTLAVLIVVVVAAVVVEVTVPERRVFAAAAATLAASTMLAASVPGWAWALTTFAAAAATLALFLILMAHLLVTAAQSPRVPTLASREGFWWADADRVRRTRLSGAAIRLLVFFAAVAVARLAMILIERPGP